MTTTVNLRIQYGSSPQFGSFGSMDVQYDGPVDRKAAVALARQHTGLAKGEGRAVVVTFTEAGASFRRTPSQVR